MSPRTVSGLAFRDALALYADAFRDATGGLEHDQCFPDLAVETIRMFASRVRADVLAEALRELAVSGEEPSQANLGRLVARLAVLAKHTEPIEHVWVQQARAFLAEHGRPTGIRFVRGVQSGTYVRDPLGFDVLPDGYAGGPLRINPTVWEIAHALRDAQAKAERDAEDAQVQA